MKQSVLVLLLLGSAVAVSAQTPLPETLRRVEALLEEVPLIDGHSPGARQVAPRRMEYCRQGFVPDSRSRDWIRYGVQRIALLAPARE